MLRAEKCAPQIHAHYMIPRIQAQFMRSRVLVVQGSLFRPSDLEFRSTNGLAGLHDSHGQAISEES